MDSAPVSPAVSQSTAHCSAARALPGFWEQLTDRDTGSVTRIKSYLQSAGIRVDGADPWDIQIRDRRFFNRVAREGSLGFGESYVDGWWEADSLDQLFARLEHAELYRCFRIRDLLWLWLAGLLLNRQSRPRCAEVAQQHYDIGNDLFEVMLGPSMQYTCGYWADAATLDDAQTQKMELVARKLYLQPGMRVLELGGGFGTLARYLATRYGCEVVSYNISGEQIAYSRAHCGGLPVRFVAADYREAAKEGRSFDRVVSVGLCEHVGPRNYRAFFELMRNALRPGGLCLLHTIGANESAVATDPWIDKYIFPNGAIPSTAQLARAAEGTWIIEDWHNFGPDYDRTLLAWWSNFDARWPELRQRYGDRFYRIWKYYLLASAGTFRARQLQVWQMVFSNRGDILHYAPVR